jgi:hypothetical protein
MNRYLLAAAIVLYYAPAKAQDLTMLEDRFGASCLPDRAQR